MVECDEAAAVISLLQSMTLHWPQQSQHHTTADHCDNSQFYTEDKVCQASLYEDSPLLEYHNTFEGSIPGIL